jgi:hypothetical protein
LLRRGDVDAAFNLCAILPGSLTRILQRQFRGALEYLRIPRIPR